MKTPKPYTYILLQTTTNTYYIGYRFLNVKEGLHWSEDLLKRYPTSSEIIAGLLENNEPLEITTVVESETPLEAAKLESNLITEYRKSGHKLFNKQNAGEYFQSVAGSESRKRGAEKIRGLVWWSDGVIEVKSLLCPSETFIRGRLKRKWEKDTTLFNNGTIQRKYKKGQEPDGWIAGRTSENKEHRRLGNMGKMWYNNGITDKKLLPEKADTSIWTPGRVFRHDECIKASISKSLFISKNLEENRKMWITNGTEERFVDFSPSIPLGWSNGKLPWKESSKLKSSKTNTGKLKSQEHKDNLSKTKLAYFQRKKSTTESSI